MVDDPKGWIKLTMDSGKEYLFRMEFTSFMNLIKNDDKFCLIDKGTYIVPKHISSMELLRNEDVK